MSPIPTSTGNSTRRRRNRGGDRRLNRALNVIATVRMVHHPRPTPTPTVDGLKARETERSAAVSSATADFTSRKGAGWSSGASAGS
ncbi:hypothetical protein [Streptomyces chartreusis]|uniref:hypothetical protein n=1 Tax=Streptomyces chartreusis TaxID=1969 RepID=UPI0038708591